MHYISAIDYVLLPLYLAFFYWRVRKMSHVAEIQDLKKYLFLAFILRMVGSVGYCMLIEYYYGYGDSLNFFSNGNFFTDQIAKDPSNIYYLFSSFKESSDWFASISTESSTFFYNPSNNLVSRISAIVSYLSFNKFLIISLFFGFFSFLGQWKLFLVFDDINKHKNRKLLGLTVLCAPSIWFWSSGLLKDSICLGAVGFMIHILYGFFTKKKFSLANITALLFLIFLVFIIKSYIIYIFLAGFALMGVVVFFKSISNTILRATLILFTILLTSVVLYQIDFSDLITDTTEKAVEQIQDFQHSYETIGDSQENSKANFDMGEFDGSINSIILKSPLAIFTCLFRPFPWESRKAIIFLASIESTLLLLWTLFVMLKLGIIYFFRLIFSTPHLLFCFTISILFALVIGFTTFNFGTMIRYKVIFMPFYFFLLVNLYNLRKVKSAE